MRVSGSDSMSGASLARGRAGFFAVSVALAAGWAAGWAGVAAVFAAGAAFLTGAGLAAFCGAGVGAGSGSGTGAGSGSGTDSATGSNSSVGSSAADAGSSDAGELLLLFPMASDFFFRPNNFGGSKLSFSLSCSSDMGGSVSRR
jgi:hypothetical protein